MKAIIKITNPDDSGVTYVVTDKKRVEMGSVEAYAAEVARIKKMAEDAGANVTITEDEE